MAIEDNTSYELTGAQVKDLAARIKSADKPLYTALGENTDGAMTQKAVREALYDDTDLKKIKIGTKQFSSDVVGDFSVGIGKSVIQSGTEGVAIGRWAEARGNYSVAIGPNSSTANNAPSVAIGYHAATNHSGAFAHAVALGDYSAPTRNYEVNIGTGSQDGYDGANDHTRVLGGVHAGILGTDAVNVDQLTAAIPGVFTGTDGTTAGTSGLVPAPAAGDQGKVLHGDGTWKDATAKLVEMSYGESNAWAKFIAAYQAGSIVYCRASSNANPATGSQTRKAFMAYVNNATNPTNVEFQYVRSVSSKTASQPVDQVYVYTLTSANGGTWTVTTRDMGPKLAQGTNTTVSYSNGTYTISATQPTVPEIKRRTNATTVVDISPLYVAGDGTTTYPMALKTHGNDRAGSFAYININEPTNSITEAYAGGYVWDMDESWWRKMSEVRLALYSDIPTAPTRTVIYNNASGTNADFTTTAAMSGYDAVEITYRDGNQNYETKTVPGSASSFVLDISHPGADSTVYWYISRFLVSVTSVTVGANNTRKAITASGVTSTLTQDIYVTSVVGINY